MGTKLNLILICTLILMPMFTDISFAGEKETVGEKETAAEKEYRISTEILAKVIYEHIAEIKTSAILNSCGYEKLSQSLMVDSGVLYDFIRKEAYAAGYTIEDFCIIRTIHFNILGTLYGYRMGFSDGYGGLKVRDPGTYEAVCTATLKASVK